jgi:hypothetical protein
MEAIIVPVVFSGSPPRVPILEITLHCNFKIFYVYSELTWRMHLLLNLFPLRTIRESEERYSTTRLPSTSRNSIGFTFSAG